MIPIQTNNLTKYYNKTLGCSNVSLNIREGEIFGFIGPNGAGKSTAIRSIIGLLVPTSGNSSIFGNDSLKSGHIARIDTGYLPGEVNMPKDMKVIDILKLSSKVRGDRGIQRVNELAKTFELNLNKKFKELSQGNKKKVGIINAIMHSPKLIIMDEPTTGLDPIMQKRFIDQIIKEKERGASILLSSHILQEVQRVCDRVAVIKEGKIIAVEEMKNLKGKYLKEVTFETKQSKPEIHLSGVSNLTVNDRLYSFTYNGNIKDLVEFISSIDIINVKIEDSSLDKIFIHFYE